MDEFSPVQQQLSEINNRYNLLGTRLNDHQFELNSVYDEVKKFHDNSKSLAQFIEKVSLKLLI